MLWGHNTANNRLQTLNDKQIPNLNVQISNKIQRHLINPKFWIGVHFDFSLFWNLSFDYLIFLCIREFRRQVSLIISTIILRRQWQRSRRKLKAEGHPTVRTGHHKGLPYWLASAIRINGSVFEWKVCLSTILNWEKEQLQYVAVVRRPFEKKDCLSFWEMVACARFKTTGTVPVVFFY